MVGFWLMEHGIARLGRGVGSFAAILHAIGTPFAGAHGLANRAGGGSGGLASLFGAFVAPANIPMSIVLLVAIFAVHLPKGFRSTKLPSVAAGGAHFGQPEYETDLLYLAGLTPPVLGGAGPLLVDGWPARRLRP